MTGSKSKQRRQRTQFNRYIYHITP